MIGIVVVLNVVCCSPLLVYKATHIVVHLIVVELVIDNCGDEDNRRLEVIASYCGWVLG